ncbi:hypothetical protein ACFOZ0_14940 [Streptomyces yaanensis]|uniref:Uncharacterized protein n=1 Tax=Streptomyces yaanensis TaxID=1142239 RepID=A0ABV7SEH3_9ACTN|nr:hypothetical protein [Streptomyces sp. CGMCC 4.7035]WNB98627.1 hypothetical protein Q2K21_11360 [Streptomyces sp. CGMCC 4.7035]
MTSGNSTGMSLARCAILAAGAVAALGATPAGAGGTADGVDGVDSADTWVGFEVVAPGGLYVSAPCAAALSDAWPGHMAHGRLGEVRVTDERAARDAAWTATVTVSQDFTAGSPDSDETISRSHVVYRPGAAIDAFNGPFTPGHPGRLTTFRMAFSHPSGSGSNSVTWNPTLIVHVPAAGVADVYRGTVTHSVA